MNSLCSFLKPVQLSVWLLVMAMALSANSMAEQINDAAALNGISEAKGVFLIDFDDVGKTAFYLKIIQGTHASMIKQGAKPDLVLVFIGKMVQFLTTDPSDELFIEHASELESIADSVKNLHKAGVRMEVCAVATQVFGIDNDTILPGMTVVGDGFISLIGWQTQGYKLEPIF